MHCVCRFHVRRHVKRKHDGRRVDVLLVETKDTYDTSAKAEGGILSQLEAELDDSSEISADVESESDYSSLLKKTLSKLEDSPADESPERPGKEGVLFF